MVPLNSPEITFFCLYFFTLAIAYVPDGVDGTSALFKAVSSYLFTMLFLNSHSLVLFSISNY